MTSEKSALPTPEEIARHAIDHHDVPPEARTPDVPSALGVLWSAYGAAGAARPELRRAIGDEPPEEDDLPAPRLCRVVRVTDGLPGEIEVWDGDPPHPHCYVPTSLLQAPPEGLEPAEAFALSQWPEEPGNAHDQREDRLCRLASEHAARGRDAQWQGHLAAERANRMNAEAERDLAHDEHAAAWSKVISEIAAERDARAKAERKAEEAFREVAAGLERERALRAELAAVKTDVDGVWLWQGDGRDHPESLSCPVVMSADTLREMVDARAKAEAKVANLRESIEKALAAGAEVATLVE